MKRIPLRIVPPLLALAAALAVPVAAGGKLTLVANEGFLIESGGKKILVDALLDGGIRGYPVAPPEMQQALERARAPFDGVDLILVTHHHGDHFGPRAVAAHLRANPAARLVSTPQVVDKSRAEIGDDPGLAARIEAVYPKEGAVEALERNGVRFEVLNLHHGKDRRPPDQNLGFLIELDGAKLLHIGDTEARITDFEPHRERLEGVDVALLPVWYLVHDDWTRVVREVIRPRTIVAMHLPRRDAPAGYFSRRGGYPALLEAVRDRFPSARIPERPGAVVSLDR